MIDPLPLIIVVMIASLAATHEHHEILSKDDHTQKYMQYLWCPSKLVGTMCPENSITYYYKCCGDLNNKCCHTTRTWVLVTGLMVPFVALTIIVVYLLKKFVFTRSSQYVAGQRQ